MVLGEVYVHALFFFLQEFTRFSHWNPGTDAPPCFLHKFSHKLLPPPHVGQLSKYYFQYQLALSEVLVSTEKEEHAHSSC